MEILKIVGRWLAVLPVVPCAYVLAKIVSAFGWGYIGDDFIYEIRESGSFSGHWIMGPIFIFQTEAISVGLALVAGVYTAPAYRLQTAIALSILSLVYIVGGLLLTGYAAALLEYTFGNIAYVVVSLLGTIGGAVGGIYYLYDEGELTSTGHVQNVL